MRAILGVSASGALLAVADVAHAQVDNAGVLDRAIKQFRSAADAWQNTAQGAATSLFWSLATISLVWTMGQLILRRAELGELFGELIRYLLFTGFWFWMLTNGPEHARLIMDSMVAVAGQTSGDQVITPSAIVDIGFRIVDRSLTQSTILSPLDSAFGIVLSLAILIVLALVAVNMLVTVIACWFVAYGGLVVLGFGGSRWTSDMAVNYYRMLLSLALQVMAMVLLVGIGESFLRSYYSALQQDVSLHEQAVLLVVAIVLLVLVNKIPPLLGSLPSGSSPQYALGGGAGLGTAMSALSAAGAVAAGGTAVAAAGAAAAIGGAKALLGRAGEVANATRAAQSGDQGSTSSTLADFGARPEAASMLSGASRGESLGQGASGGSVFPAAITGTSAQTISVDDRRSGTSAERSTKSDGAHPQADAAQQASDERKDAGATRARQDSETKTARDTQRSSGDRASELSTASRAPATQQPSAAEGISRSFGNAPPQRQGSEKSTPAGGFISASGPASGSTTDWPATGQTARTAPAAPPPLSSASTAATASLLSSPVMPATHPTSSLANTAATSSSPRRHEAGAAPLLATGGGPRPTVQSAASAPRGALAGASQQAVVTQDLAFRGSGATEAKTPKKAPLDPTPQPPPERSELPAAYSMQASVDVEAEVAAFRDRD